MTEIVVENNQYLKGVYPNSIANIVMRSLSLLQVSKYPAQGQTKGGIKFYNSQL